MWAIFCEYTQAKSCTHKFHRLVPGITVLAHVQDSFMLLVMDQKYY